LKLDVFSLEGSDVTITLDEVKNISTIRANVPETNQKAVLSMQLQKILAHDRFKDSGIPAMDPVNDMKISAELIDSYRSAIAEFVTRRESNPIFKALAITEADQSPIQTAAVAYFAEFNRRISTFQALKNTEATLELHNSLVLREELKSMKRVLRRLEFVDKSDVVMEKGKMGCEVSSCDEILLTEMVFQNVFEGLSGEQVIALCSCLILDEKSDDTALPNDQPDLVKAYERTKVIAQELAEVMLECKVPNFDQKEYLEKIKPQLMSVVMMWLEGKSFVDIMKATELFEGSVVRVLRRLEELVRELCLAAKSIGHKELEDKVMEARKKLRRGIIFSASLYL
jgi:ATP-dependent RNA helicase DOB1